MERAADDLNHQPDGNQEPSEAQKRENVVRLAFGGDEERFRKFVETVRAGIPVGVGLAVVDGRTMHHLMARGQEQATWT